MPAQQTRSFKKSICGRAAPTRDRKTPSAGPHKDAAKPTAVPAAFQPSAEQSSGGRRTCEAGKRGGDDGVDNGAHFLRERGVAKRLRSQPIFALFTTELRFLKFRLILECSLESINLG